ncbi:MAG: Asp-tRNA(Asn)/Glu-tRNA(Gln) amidotransferase subunit GatA [Verrucomicrobia bacterium]|nr:Asp-tRNA(Asn)/Glu-tRNA(Gln) amidotransferase subunit GatA [Verrucomicrobiota bacterium]
MPTITQLRASYQSGDLTPSDAIRSLAETIESRDPEIKGYISYDTEAALAEAEKVDLSLPLGGVPIAIKDVINVKGQPCTCGSKYLAENYTAPYDAGVIKKLRAAGAIPFGRANMDEFAMGSSTENSAIQTTRNPWDTSRIPGGSSGGSAAVVAADEAIAALGSDTGGSIRQPAALCGCVGLKPTYGRVSRYGLVAFASSLDQIGPMTQTVEDAALLLQAISGHDSHDSTCIDEPVPDYSSFIGQDIKGLKVGLPKEYFAEGLDSGVKSAVETAIQQLESLGAEPVEISLPHTEYAVATYYIIATAEASTNLARFDGVRYGHRSENAGNLIEQYHHSREEGFGEEVKRRIILGTYVLSSGYYDAYYIQAQKVRTLIRKDFTDAFEKVDLIASPVTPSPAFKIGEKSDDPLAMYLADIYTISANLAGICGISVPCGFTATDDGKQLPIGLQLLGKPFGEGELIKAAHAYEQATDWQKLA